VTAGTVNVTYMSAVTPEAIEWYWHGRLARGKLTVFDGLPGMGKTTVGLDLIARFTRGAALPGEHAPVPKTRVGILSDEDGVADTTVPRLKLAGADLDMVCQLTGTSAFGGPRSLMIPDDLPVIAQIIKEEKLGYLHIDPLAAHAGAKVNLYIDQDVRTQITSPLAHLAAQTGVTIVLVRHPTKAQTGPAMLRGGGSIGIIGAARFGLMFGHNPHHETERVIASTKCNVGPMPESLIYKLNGVPGTDHAQVWWDPIPSALTADDLLPAPAKASAKKMNAAEEWLLEYLDLESRPANDLLSAGIAAGHTEITLKRAKASLGITSTRTGFGEGAVYFWCLPGQEPRADTSSQQTGFGWASEENGYADPWAS
jgi:hypothetical protein